MPGVSSIDSFSRRGLADLPATSLGPVVVGAWDEFLTLAADLDLTAPTRLSGWRVHDVLVHLGAWDDHRPVDDLLASVQSGASTAPSPPDADTQNKRLVEAHHDATPEQVLAALQDARDRVATYFDDGSHDELGRQTAHSTVGPLPVGAVVNATCYELAVHALDVAPDRASWHLLSRGLAALADVTGALSARHGIAISVASMTPTGGWRFESSADGWTTTSLPPGRVDGTGIEGDAALILDVSAGRHNAVPLLMSRKLVVHRLPTFLRLAPLVEEVPGIPGGAALRPTIKHLAGAGRLLGKLPGLRRG
jgi:uncharacterized protein (TIGR03083 family)